MVKVKSWQSFLTPNSSSHCCTGFKVSHSFHKIYLLQIAVFHLAVYTWIISMISLPRYMVFERIGMLSFQVLVTLTFTSHLYAGTFRNQVVFSPHVSKRFSIIFIFLRCFLFGVKINMKWQAAKVNKKVTLRCPAKTVFIEKVCDIAWREESIFFKYKNLPFFCAVVCIYVVQLIFD